MPKVIDFGMAKATNQKLTEKTLFTNFATMIGTPAYMSPEQAEMSSMDVDTRSDSLGRTGQSGRRAARAGGEAAMGLRPCAGVCGRNIWRRKIKAPMPLPSALRSKIRSASAEETRGAWRLEVN